MGGQEQPRAIRIAGVDNLRAATYRARALGELSFCAD